MTEAELLPVLRTATIDRPVLVLADDPEAEKASLEAKVDAAGLPRPAYRSGRDILIAVWPPEALDQD